MMHLNTNTQHNKDVLNRIIMRLSFVVFILLGAINLFAQPTLKVCDQSTFSGYDIFEADKTPNGHRSEGEWTSTGGLIFSNINDPNSLITVPSGMSGQTVNIVWTYKNGTSQHSYDIQISGLSWSGSDPVLESGGTTDDVLLCSKTSVDFTINPDEESTYTYQIWKVDPATGMNTLVDDNNVKFTPEYTVASADYDLLDGVFTMVKENTTGCAKTTNTITISDVSTIQVQVVGGITVCTSGALPVPPIELEVIPYNTSDFQYRWMVNGVEDNPRRDDETYPIMAFGDYRVDVYSKGGSCPGEPFSSNTVTARNFDLPNVSIVNTPNSICTGETSLDIEASLDAVPTNPVEYDWVRNTSLLEDGGNSIFTNTTLPLAGDYKVIIREVNNAECWAESPIHTVSNLGITGLTIAATNGLPAKFCLSGDPNLNIAITGGTAPYDVTFSNDRGLPAEVFSNVAANANLDLNTLTVDNTNYWVSSITDATGCSLNLVQDATSSNYAQFGVYTSPSNRPVTSSTICETSSTTVQLPNSEIGIDYEIYRDGISLFDTEGEPIQTGDGTTLTWGPYNTPGAYIVKATTVSCTDITMSGSVVIEQDVALVNMISSIAGPLCSDPLNAISFSIDSSEDGVDYTLYRNYGGGLSEVAIETISGNPAGSGFPFNFPQYLPGTYSVVASRNGVCDKVMSNTYTINQSPDVSAINITITNTCDNVNTTIGLDDSEGGVYYTLWFDDDDGNPDAVATAYGQWGDGDDINLVNNQIMAAGTYTVIAKRGSCEEWVSGSVTINATPSNVFSTMSVACKNGTISIKPGEAGVNYTLLIGGSPDLASYPTVIAPVSWTGLNPEIYTVRAERSGCVTDLSGQLVVEADPLPQTVTWSSTYCEGQSVGVDIELGGSELGKVYILRDDSDDSEVDSFTGNGASHTFSDVNEGSYYVEARSSLDPNACSKLLADNINIVEIAEVPVGIDELPGDFCEDQGVVPLTGRPRNSSGVWSGAGLGSFLIDIGDGTATFNTNDPGVSGGTYTITYTYTDGNGCVWKSDDAVEIATVHANTIDTDLGIVGLGNSYCATSADVEDIQATYLGVNVTSAAAVFSGPGITNNGDGTADFSPSTAGLGVHTITLTYTDVVTNCSGSMTQSVQVGTPMSIQNIDAQYCSDDDTDYPLIGWVNGALPAVGTTTFDILGPNNYEVTGIPNNTDDFNPEQTVNSNGGEVGTYQIVFHYNDGTCDNTLTQDVEILKAPDAYFTFPLNGGIEQTNFCYNHGIVELTPTDPDISSASYTSRFYLNNSTNPIGNQFDTENSLGLKYFPDLNVITHEVENGICSSTETRSFRINKIDEKIYTLCNVYFQNSGSIIIRSDELDRTKATADFDIVDIGGNSVSWIDDQVPDDNRATINPAGQNPGVYTVRMTYKDVDEGCVQVVEESFTLYGEINILGIDDNEKICQDSPTRTLQGTPLPTGGTGSFTVIAGLTNTANNGEATLDPSAMLPGTYTIEYTFEGADACTHTFSKSIEIVQAPIDVYDIQVEDNGIFCIGGTGVRIGLSGSTTNVTYELLYNNTSFSTPVIFNGDGTDFWFDDDATGNGAGAEIEFTTEGSYTVRASSNSCTAMMNGTVAVDEYELVLQLDSKIDITCNGLSDGKVTIVATGGSGSYEYSDDGGASWQASPTFTGLALGPHDFSVKDMSSAACEAIDVLTVTITQPTALSAVEIDNVNVGCAGCSVAGGTCEGSSTITISGGTPDYLTYPGVGYGIAWSTGGAALTETNMPAGNHSVTVTDGNGCTFNLGIFTDTNPALTITENAGDHVDNLCKDGAEGSYTVTAAGGSGSYEFSLTDPAITAEVWLPGNIAADQYELKKLEDGSYNIWVRDADPLYNRCITQIATPIVITEPAALTLVEESQVGITCNGEADGSFVVRASGGESGTYQFTTDDPALVAAPSWVVGNSGADGYTESLLGAGTYKVWVRDLANPTCGYTSVSVVIADVPVLSYTLIEHTNVSCYLGFDGRLEVLGQGGSGNYVYEWKNSVGAGVVISTDAFAENLNEADGPYTVTITDVPNSCGPVVQTFTITDPAELTVQNITVTDADCAGQNTGSIELEVVGGTAPYTITWSTGANLVLPASGTISIGGLAPGNYNIDITDSELCTYNNAATPWVVGQLSAITLEAAATIVNNTCNGGNEGSIYVKVDGGSGDYEFRLEGPIIKDWSNSTSATMDDFTFTGLVEGNYDVKVRDKNNTACEYLIGNYALVDPAALNLTINSITDATCFGVANGSITITASGGSGTYQFNVDNGGYNAGDNVALFTEAGLLSGNHTIWVRDSKATGCEYKLHPVITVNQPLPLNLTISNSTDASCFNIEDGLVILSATGGSGNYDYSKDGGATWQVGTGATYTYDFLGDGAYVFQVRDHNDLGCAVATVNHTVTEPSDFTTTCVATNIDCFGDATGVLTISTQYSNGDPGAFVYSIDGGVTWKSSPLTGLTAGAYVVDVKDNTTGCIKTNQVLAADATITQPTTPITIGAELITDVKCNGELNGEIDLQGNVSGGTIAVGSDYTYTWYKKGTPNVIQDQGIGVDRITGLTNGTYFVEVKDDNLCLETSNDFVVNQPLAWDVSFTSTNLTKYNGGDGIIDVYTCNGSNGGYSIAWYEKVGAVYNLIPALNNVWKVTTFDAGIYQFIITDSKACTYTSIDIPLTQPFDFIVTDPTTTSTNVSCFGGDNGEIKIFITQGNGDYNLKVDGTLEKGGPNYTDDIDQNTNTYTLSNLEAGSYYLELTDIPSGEVYTKTVVISQPAELTITPTPTDITCEGNDDGKLSVDLSGHLDGGSISWSADNGYAKGPENILAATKTYLKSDLLAGNYTVTVTNNNGCAGVQEKNIVIAEPAAWNVTTSVTDVTSYGNTNGSVTVDFPPTGNTAPYTISWADGPSTAWSRSGLGAGDYTFTITDKNGAGTCTYTETLIIEEPNQLLFDLTATAATCYGYANGTIGVNITSGNPNYKIVLTGTEFDGAAFIPVTITGNTIGSHLFSNLKAGNYDVAITDDEGENLTKSVTVSQLAQFSVKLVDSNNITCNTGDDGSIEVEIDGRVIVETKATINWTRTSPAGWSLTGTVNDGTNDLKDQTGLEAGTYTINVSDQFGCDAIPLVEVLTEPDAITATHSVTHVSTAGGTDGRILITNIVSENNVQSVVWNKKNAGGTYDPYLDGGGVQVTGNDNEGIETGVYQYVITDDNGCTYTSEDINVTEPGALIVSVTDTDINCYGDDNGIISVNITSGTAPYSVTLTGIPDDGSGFAAQTLTLTNSVFTGLKPGTYKVDVVDAASQTYSLAGIKITQNAETVLTETLKDITCFGQGDGTISMSLSGNVNVGVDQWQVIDPNGATVYNGVLNGNATQPAALAGDYNIIVTNQHGCNIADKYTITEPVAWDVHHVVTPVTPTGASNGVINIDVLNGNTPFSSDPLYPEDYSITWTGPAGAPLVDHQRLQTGLPAGTYTYHIEDAQGCTYDSGDIIVAQPTALTASLTDSDVDILCYGDDKGRITVNVLTGNEPYSINITGNQYNGIAYNDNYTLNTNTGSYSWDDLLAGEYEIQIADNVGNVFTQSAIMLTQPNQNIITEDVTHLTCHAADKGPGEVSVQLNRNFIAGDKVVWTGPEGIIDNGVLPLGSDKDVVTVYEGGNYTYTFTDGNGCPISGTITVAEPDAFTIDYTATDATIFGNADGIIDVHTVTGSNGVPYTISWIDNGTPSSVTDFLRNDLIAGIYSFTITDTPNGCDTTITNIVIGQPKELIVNVTPKDAICYGDKNGEIQVEFTSHNSGLSYQITGNTDDGNPYDSGLKDPVLATSVVTGLKAGTYEINAYDSKGTHYHEDNIRIEQEPEVTLSATIKDISCYGAADGNIIVALNGRVAEATDNITWTGTKSSFVKGDLINNDEINPVTSPEEFYVVVSSAEGCKYTGTFEVEEPNEIVISLDDVEHVTCSGGNNGSIDVSVTGRSGGGYTYTWEKKDAGGTYQAYAGTTASLEDLYAGEYQVTVESITDACTAVLSDIEIVDGSAITIHYTKSDITTCVGDNSGIIAVSVEDGIAPYTVDVTGQPTKTGDGSAAFVFENLVAGDYVIEVSDARGVGCATVTQDVTIDEPAHAFNVSGFAHDIACDAAQTTSGTFSFNVTGGVAVAGKYNYQILLPEASLVYPLSINENTTSLQSVNNLEAGTYTLTVLDMNSTDPASCAVDYQFTLEHIVITNNPVVHTTCEGVNNGAITGINIAGASANYTYNWTTTDGGIGIDNSTLNQSGLSVGTYILEITDSDRGGCSVTKEFYVDVDNTISIMPTIKDITCNGGNDGAITLDVTGVSASTTYSWTGPAIVTDDLQNQVSLTAGNYTVEVTSIIDGQTCKADAAYTVAQPNPITYDASYEYTDCDPFVRTLKLDNVTGGSGAYTYLWDGPAFSPVIPADPTDVDIYQGGVYSITIKDENQCEATKSLSVPNEITINPVVNHVKCDGGKSGSIVLNVAGGTGAYTFAWTGPGAYTSNNRNIDNLYAGIYTVIITDTNENDGSGNCFRTFNIEIEDPEPIVIDPTVVHTSCFGLSDGQIEIEVSGGTAPYTYKWSPVVGANLVQNKDQYDLPADIYTVSVTDNNGCKSNRNIEVEEDDEIIITSTPTETLCDGTAGEIDITVTGGSGAGFSYDWNSADGSGLIQGVEDQTGLTGGTYTVVVSDLGDGRACTASTSATLTHKIEVVNDVIIPVTCSGNDDGSIDFDVIGGDGNYSYSWTTISGDPTRVVTSDQNQSGLSEGEYQVTITDGRISGGTDCAITKTFIVPATTGLSVNVAVSDSKMCFGEPGGRLEASVTGGSGDYKYYWNGVEGTAVLDNQVQGIYGLEVVDNVLGCNYIQSYEIKGPAAPLTIDNVVVTNVLCHNENTGAIQVTVSGGTLPASGDYIYTWTGGASPAIGSNPTNLFAGIYNLTVTDDNGCTVESGNIEVTQPGSHIKVDNPQITDVSVVGGSDGVILVDVYDGVAPRSVQWFKQDASDVYQLVADPEGKLNPLDDGVVTSGTYKVIATDNNGCSASIDGIRVIEPGEALGFEKTVHQISPCNGADNGEIHINRVFGGFAIAGSYYRIQVTGPGVNEDVNDTELSLTGLAPGTYRVIVTDNVPVSYQEDIVIAEYPSLTLTTTAATQVACYGESTGVIEVTVGGGRPDVSSHYLVEITSAEGYYDFKDDAVSGVPFDFTGLPAGNYTVTLKDHAEDFDTKVPDRGNCELSDFTLITEPAAEVEISSVSGGSDICVGDSYDLAINTSNWDFATQGNLRVAVYDDFNTTEYLVDQSPYVITVNPASSRTYEITRVFSPSNATCLQGETTGNQVQLTVHDLPTAAINGPTEVCEDGTVQLTVSFTGKQPFSFTWQDMNNGTSNTISGITSNTYTFTDTPVADASYIVLSVSDDYSCTNSGNGQVDVAINNKPLVTLSGSTDICIGETTPLTIGFNENNGPYTITYEANGSEGTLVVNPTAALTYTWNVIPKVTTTYDITSVVDANGCAMDITVPVEATVIVNQLPESLSVINSTLDSGEICQGTSGIDYSVDAVTYATNYVWSVDAGMTITSGNGTTNVTVDFDRSFPGGYIRVYPENDCGVNSTIERWVNAKVLPDPILVAPSGDQNLCQSETGVIYSIPPVDNATSYEWSLPAGLILQGDGSGTSIIVDLDPNVPSTTGEIFVRPINDCSADEPWSPGLTINITPLPISDAGPDDRICQTTYTLNAAPLKAGETGVWTIIEGAGQFGNKAVDQARPNADIWNLSQGENIFVWTVTNSATGCSTSDEVIIYNDQVTVTASASDDEVCEGQVTLFGTPVNAVDSANEGLWSTTGGGFIVASTNDNTVVTDLDPGVNSFTWTIRKGACYSTATVDVINNQPTEPIIYNASDVVISLQDLPCQTDFTTLRGSSPAAGETGYWRIESGAVTIDNLNSASINITNIAKGDHVLSWNILNGDCHLKSLVTLRNNALDVSAGEDHFTCSGTTMLAGTDVPADAIGQWTILEGTGNFVDGGDKAVTEVTGLDQSTPDGRNVFRWSLTRNGCTSFDEVTVYNDQPSVAEIVGGSRSISVCDYEYNLNAVPPIYGTGVWSVVAGQGRFDNPADPSTRVYDIANGDNVFRWTVTNNTCATYVDFTVTNLHVDAYAGPDTAVCGRVAELRATPAPEGAVGQWTLVSGSAGVIFNPSNTQANASATSLGHGTNALVWTVTRDGCVSSDTVIVSNNQPYEVNASSYIYTDNNYTTLRAEIPDIGTGVWTLVEGRGEIENPSSATTRVNNLLPNYNYFRWTVTNVNCVEYIDVAVQSGVLAEADAGLDQLHLCEDNTTLHANDPEGTYGEWTIDEGSGVFEDSNAAQTKISGLRPGRNIFRWTLRFAGGSENFTTDTVIVVNNKPSVADAGIDLYECGDVVTLNAREPIYGTPSWSILSGGGVFADDTDPKTEITSLAKGENVLKYQIQNDACFSYDTVSVFNHEPSDAYAGEDQVVCKDSAVLNPEIPQYGIGKWRIIEGSGKGKDASGNEIDEISSGYVYSLAPGTNKLVWEVQVEEASSDCVKRDTITIVNNQPSVSFAGHNRSICTDTVSLSGSIPIYGEGTWTLISGQGEIVDSSLTNTLVRNLGKGKNLFRWTIDNNGCTSVSDVEIANNLIEAIAGYDQVLCVDTAILEANNPSPGLGTWGIVGGSGSANFVDNESPYTEVKNLDKGENILTWTIDYKGCRSVSQVKVTNNEPSQAIAGDNKATCENRFVLSAAEPEVGIGSWTIRSGGGVFDDDLDNTTEVTNLKFGANVFRWTVENNNCTLYDDVEISYNTIQAVVGGTQEICADHTFLDANNAAPGVGTWSVIGGSSQARFEDTHDPTTEVLDLAKGSNLLRWTINNEGCVTTAEVTVVNHTPSTAYAGNTQEICENNTTLDATPVDIGTGSWEVLIGAATIPADQVNNPKASITGLSKGDNIIRWTVTSDNGLCTSVDEVDVINNEPSEPYAGADEEYCSPTVVLKAAVPDFGVGNWSIIEGGGNFDDSTKPDATISNLNEGINVLRWTITQGQCSKQSDIEVLNNTPTSANAGPDIEDCKDYANLDANLPTQGEGFWTLISGNASFVDEKDAKTRVEGLTFGENILMWNVQKGGCISSDQITVFNQVPDQAAAGTDRTSCDDYLTLNANDPKSGVGTWTVLSGNGAFDNPNDPTTIVRELGLGENRFKWTVAYGSCTTEDVVEVVSNKADPYAGEDEITYEPTFEMKASNPGDLGATWSIVAGAGEFDDNTYFNTMVRNLNEGINTFRWLMNVNGCITYDDVSIEYRVVPDAAFVVDTTQGCYPLTIQFTNYSDGGTNFMWDFGDGYTSTDRNPVHTFEDPGTYTVTLIAPGPDGVNGEYTKDILVHDHPVAEFSYGPDVVYVPGDLLRCYSLSVDAQKYFWEFGDGGTSEDVNPLHEYESEGVFDLSLTVESKHGCVDEIVKPGAVTTVLQGFVKFPTAFTPRPDGGTVNTIGGGETNTVFRPVYRDVDSYKLQIFNRWGQMIYESTDIEEGWDGFYNSELSPQGVYVWKATGTFVSGKVFTEAGSVLLVR